MPGWVKFEEKKNISWFTVKVYDNLEVALKMMPADCKHRGATLCVENGDTFVNVGLNMRFSNCTIKISKVCKWLFWTAQLKF